MNELRLRVCAVLAAQTGIKANKKNQPLSASLKEEESNDWQTFFKELYAVINKNGPVPTLCSLSARSCPVSPKVETRCGLSPREIQCLTLAAQGKTSAETATLLKVTVRTVNFHFSNVFSKLQVKNKQAAVAMAIQLRYI